MTMLSYSDQMAADGYAVIPDLIEPHVVRDVCEFIRAEGIGTRRLIDEPWCADLARQIGGDERVRLLLPQGAVAAQCTLFSKTIETNRLVPLGMPAVVTELEEAVDQVSDFTPWVTSRAHCGGCQPERRI
jgi:hypothetical protein